MLPGQYKARTKIVNRLKISHPALSTSIIQSIGAGNNLLKIFKQSQREISGNMAKANN
jgi:hypothetical protein